MDDTCPIIFYPPYFYPHPHFYPLNSPLIILAIPDHPPIILFFSTTILFFLDSLRTTASEREIITSAGKSNFLQKVLYKLVIFVDNEIVVKIMLLFADLDCLQFHTSVPELVA